MSTCRCLESYLAGTTVIFCAGKRDTHSRQCFPPVLPYYLYTYRHSLFDSFRTSSVADTSSGGDAQKGSRMGVSAGRARGQGFGVSNFCREVAVPYLRTCIWGVSNAPSSNTSLENGLDWVERRNRTMPLDDLTRFASLNTTIFHPRGRMICFYRFAKAPLPHN